MESSILEKIYRAVLKFLASTDPDETYAIVVQEAIRLVNGDAGRIVLEEDGEFKIVYTSAPIAELPKVVRKKGWIYTSFTKHQAFLVTREQIAAVYPDIAELGIQSGLLIPLSFRGKAIGVLAVESYKPETFTTKELEILKLFGSIVTLRIKNVQLYFEMKKSLENRDLFISLAAHELRTPITTIYGYSQLLYEKTKNKNSVESRWISSLHAESYRLTLLIKDLLEINHIRAGNLNYSLKECSLREVVERAVDNFRFNSPKKEVILNDNLGKRKDVIVGDFDKLLQVIINLLDNASKFSSEETPIIVNLDSRLRNLIIQVKDQGQGIPKKDLPKIFEGFYKGKDTTNEGMGLGLYLCKNIIEEHRGDIHLHSKVGKGTIAEIQLPRAKI